MSAEMDSEEFGPWGRDGPPEDIMRLVCDWYIQAFNLFTGSKVWESLDGDQKTFAYAGLRNFSLWMLTECGETPAEWSSSGVDYLMLDIIRHDYPQSEGYRKAFIPVLVSFLNWLGDNGHLATGKELAVRVEACLPDGLEPAAVDIRREILMGKEQFASIESGSSELDRAANLIARYTETVCGELRQNVSGHDPLYQQFSLFGLCPCGSGRSQSECCGRSN